MPVEHPTPPFIRNGAKFKISGHPLAGQMKLFLRKREKKISIRGLQFLYLRK